MPETNEEKLTELLKEAANELDAWCMARPDLAGETPNLIKRIEETLKQNTDESK